MKDKFINILKSCSEFKITTHFWNKSPLEPHENSIRNYPAPWLKKTCELLDIIGGNTVVEIGSTRREFTMKCVEYYENSYNLLSKDAPPCCQDGHATYFFAANNYEVHTVDIDPYCKIEIEKGYKHHIKTPKPDNLHIHIEDGIEFLKNFEGKIDLLYLDGWDVGTPNYAEKHLESFHAAKDKLSDLHIISVDDTDFNTKEGGKDKLLTPYLLENGYVKVLWGRQSVFVKIPQ